MDDSQAIKDLEEKLLSTNVDIEVLTRPEKLIHATIRF